MDFTNDWHVFGFLLLGDICLLLICCYCPAVGSVFIIWIQCFRDLKYTQMCVHIDTHIKSIYLCKFYFICFQYFGNFVADISAMQNQQQPTTNPTNPTKCPAVRQPAHLQMPCANAFRWIIYGCSARRECKSRFLVKIKGF